MEDLTNELETGFITELDRIYTTTAGITKFMKKLGAHPKICNGKQECILLFGHLMPVRLV